jgi:hypothetical protein
MQDISKIPCRIFRAYYYQYTKKILGGILLLKELGARIGTVGGRGI